MSKLAQEKEEVKALIRSILTSSKDVMTAHSLHRDYKNMAGSEVPYQKLGFYNFEAFLRSIPDTVLLQSNGLVLLVASEKSKHIDELVQKQKINTKKRGPRMPVRRATVAPVMTMASSSQKPFIQQSVQKKILDYLAQNPTPSGGPSCNGQPVAREECRHIDESTYTTRNTQRRYRVPLMRSTISPAMTMVPSLKTLFKTPLDNEPLQRMISDCLAEYPRGVELYKLEKQLLMIRWDQYGGSKMLLSHLPHIAKVEGGKAYPVNVKASKETVPPPKVSISQSSNILPAGYIDDNSDYSYCSDEEPVTKPVNEQAMAKQPTEQNVNESALKERVESEVELGHFNVHEPAHRQSTTNSSSELMCKQFTVSNASEHVYRPHISSDSSFGEPCRQSTLNRLSELALKQSESKFNEPEFRPHKVNSFTEPTFKQTNINEPVNTQSKVKHLADPDSFSTFMLPSGSVIPQVREATSTSHISEKMKQNLQILAEEHPNGIWCSELPELYKKHFGVDLNVQNLGFVTVVQFVTDIPEVFHSVQASEADWMVFDARKELPKHVKEYKEGSKHIPIPEHVVRNLKKLTLRFESGISCDRFAKEYLDTFGKPLDVSEWGFDTVSSFLLSLQNSVLVVHFVGHQMIIQPKPGVEKEVAMPLIMFSDMDQYIQDIYPVEVVGPSFVLPQQELPPNLKSHDSLEVLVSEVFTPSKFYIQLRGRDTTEALDKLMADMQEFYNTEFYNEAYKMREQTYRLLQHCVAPYCDEYHRAVITAVFADEVAVTYIDYGTAKVVKKQTLRYLHNDFASFPAQAIRAKLVNLRPAKGPDIPWPVEACKFFLELVADTPLVALVHTVDYQSRTLEVALVNTNGADDVHINDTLKREGYADYCVRKKVSPLKQPKQNRQEVTTDRGTSKSSSNKTVTLAKECDTDGSQSANKGSDTAPNTSTKKSDDEEEPIIISAERSRVLSAPPGFSNRAAHQVDPVALMNFALYGQMVRQQQQQQAFQELVAYHPGLLMQGNPMGTTFVTPYAPVMSYPVAPLVAQVPVGHAAVFNTVMPNIAQVPSVNATMINTVMPNIAQVPPVNPTMISTVVPNITEVPPVNPTMMSTVVPNITEVPANTNTRTVDSATMTTFEDNGISELTQNLNISLEENKYTRDWTSEANTKVLNNIPVEEEDFDEDYIFRSDSEGEEPDHSNRLQADSQEESNVIKEEQVISNNYDNVNVRQPQSAPQQVTQAIIPPASMRPPDTAVQNKKPVPVKVMEIAKQPVHIINIRGEPYMCTDEFIHVFTHFSGRHVILKILEAKRIKIPFKDLKKHEHPKIFQSLQSSQVQGIQRPSGFIPSQLHIIPLSHVAQLLRLLKIDDRKILQGIQATLENSTTNKHFWLEQ